MGYRAAGLSSGLSCASVTPFRSVGAGEVGQHQRLYQRSLQGGEGGT